MKLMLGKSSRLLQRVAFPALIGIGDFDELSIFLITLPVIIITLRYHQVGYRLVLIEEISIL